MQSASAVVSKQKEPMQTSLIRTLQLFCQASPDFVVQHACTLQPYFKVFRAYSEIKFFYSLQDDSDVVLIGLLAAIFTAVLPRMGQDQDSFESRVSSLPMVLISGPSQITRSNFLGDLKSGISNHIC